MYQIIIGIYHNMNRLWSHEALYSQNVTEVNEILRIYISAGYSVDTNKIVNGTQLIVLAINL